jgi:hypothetical protein
MMTQLSTIACAADEAIQQVTQQLEQAGLQVSRSFDLRSARAVEIDCTCAHQSDNCDCTMVVLLVYGQESRYPITLVVHSHNGRTWLSLSNGMGERTTAKIKLQIKSAVVTGHLAYLCSGVLALVELREM